MTNRLAEATSPYLQQHASNPVHWFEWGDEAFAEANRRDVPIFLSIGYAACHWCHVMAHESFEDQATADFLGEHFVSIKVDREERPDVDAVYMAAVQALSGHGGWPMTVFLDPQQRPFHAGTYFPKEPRAGMPSFLEVLAAVSRAWAQKRSEVEQAAAQISDGLAAQQFVSVVKGPEDDLVGQLGEATTAALRLLIRDFDKDHAGFGNAPKFPPSSVLEFLLRHHARTGDRSALAMVEQTCEAMARGGIYDQLAGGFARYSVDHKWVVPHFEKMLYDNALLLRVYTHWYRRTGSPFAARIVRETAGFLLNDLRTADGGFASALDADAPTEVDGHAHEGTSYVWTPAQLTDVVGADRASAVAELLSVTPGGTFEHGSSTLQLLNHPPDNTWPRTRAALKRARDRRPQPTRDDKVVAAWNGLAIAALAEAGALLDQSDWIDAATQAAELLRDLHLVEADGELSLLRVSRDGKAGVAAGVLEDYGDVAEGFLALSAIGGDQQWRRLAGRLLDTVLAKFSNPGGGFFDTADDSEQLFIRPVDPADLAVPSGWSAAAGALLTYGTLMSSEPHLRAAEDGLGMAAQLGKRAPRFAGWLLASAEAYLAGPIEVVVVGPLNDPIRREFHEYLARSNSPGITWAVGEPSQDGPFRNRGLVNGHTAAYLCRRSVCEQPVTTLAELQKSLPRPLTLRRR